MVSAAGFRSSGPLVASLARVIVEDPYLVVIDAARLSRRTHLDVIDATRLASSGSLGVYATASSQRSSAPEDKREAVDESGAALARNRVARAKSRVSLAVP